MADAPNNGLIIQLPEEMLRFVLDASHSSGVGPRLGQLFSHGRPPMPTPHYVAACSRGAIPHIAHDVLQKFTSIDAVYMGLEDFIEKSVDGVPVYKQPIQSRDSRLRKFTALPSQCLSILGPRRVPPLPCPAQNTNESIAICCSVGFRTLSVEQYLHACHLLRSDISCSIADVNQAEKSSRKRIEKSADRTHAWLRDTISVSNGRWHQQSTFASIPPLDKEQMQLYLDDLATEYRSNLAGLSIHDPSTATFLGQTELSPLLRLSLSNPLTPQALLHAIDLGVDLMTVPFVTIASEAGIAFAYHFPPPAALNAAESFPLGVSLWSDTYAGSASALALGCECYTCTKHSAAYVHHLLQAKEMLAWTLLQIHNFAMLDKFFQNVRTSIRDGTFGDNARDFRQAYESEFRLEDGKGRGPRVRGYQLGRESRENRGRVWGRFEYNNADGGIEMSGLMANAEAVEDGAVVGEEFDVVEIEKLGLAEKEDSTK